MKKKKIIFLILLFLNLISNTFGQAVVFNRNKVPAIGSKKVFSEIDDSSYVNQFNFNKSGNNNIWDFTKLPHNYYDTFFYDLKGTYSKDFPKADFCFRFKQNQFQYESYMYSDSNGLYLIGETNPVFTNTGPICPKWNPQIILLKFPYNYKDSILQSNDMFSNYIGHYDSLHNLVDSTYIKYNCILSSKIIATGFINLPSGSFAAVLEKSEANCIDSLFMMDSISNWKWRFKYIVGYGGNTNYNWYSNYSTEVIARFYDDYKLILYNEDKLNSLDEEASDMYFELYPNPSENKIYLSSNFLNKRFKFEITDILGRTVFIDAYNDDGIDIKDYNKGVYFLNIITSDNLFYTKRFVKL